MCDFETNILHLLKEEKKRLTKMYVEKDAPYLKSLEHGIQTATKNLEDCHYKKCKEELFRTHTWVSPIHLYNECKK